jgi:hypothetical protein
MLGPAVLTRFRRVGRVDALEESEAAMLDIGMIVIDVGFFVASILYVLACEKK